MYRSIDPDEPVLRQIQDWSAATFPKATVTSTLAYLKREMGELERVALDRNVAQARPAVADELADHVHLLCQLARLWGIDLDAVTRAKFVQNQLRSWQEPDAEGVVEHVRNEPLPLPLGGLATNGRTFNPAVVRQAGKPAWQIIKEHLEAHPKEVVTHETLRLLTGTEDVGRTCRRLEERFGMVIEANGDATVTYRPPSRPIAVQGT